MHPGHTILSTTKHRGQRAVVSAAAVVGLVLGTFGTAAAVGEPQDADTNADDDASAAADAVYEPCSANFGLGKVVEIVVEVDGSVPTPPLTFPEDVEVVTTFEPGSETVTCIPEPVTDALWDSETFWGVVLDVPAPVGNYVFLPFEDESDACSEPQTMDLVGHPAGYTVKVGQAIVAPTPSFACGDTSAPVHEAAASILTAPELAALDDYLDNGCDDGTGPSADLEDAADALAGTLDGAFLTGYEDASDGATPCGAVTAAYDWFAFQTVYGLEVGRQAVFDLTTPRAPDTPATPPAAVVVTPAFTG